MRGGTLKNECSDLSNQSIIITEQLTITEKNTATISVRADVWALQRKHERRVTRSQKTPES
jgi:hypothetical protein